MEFEIIVKMIEIVLVGGLGIRFIGLPIGIMIYAIFFGYLHYYVLFCLFFAGLYYLAEKHKRKKR